MTRAFGVDGRLFDQWLRRVKFLVYEVHFLHQSVVEDIELNN